MPFIVYPKIKKQPFFDLFFMLIILGKGEAKK